MYKSSAVSQQFIIAVDFNPKIVIIRDIYNLNHHKFGCNRTIYCTGYPTNVMLKIIKYKLKALFYKGCN